MIIINIIIIHLPYYPQSYIHLLFDSDINDNINDNKIYCEYFWKQSEVNSWKSQIDIFFILFLFCLP